MNKIEKAELEEQLKKENKEFKRRILNNKPFIETKPIVEEITPLPMWNLTKCYTGEIMNGLQINYGNKNITILITDDLYLELKKLTEIPKEDKTSNE